MPTRVASPLAGTRFASAWAYTCTLSPSPVLLSIAPFAEAPSGRRDLTGHPHDHRIATRACRPLVPHHHARAVEDPVRRQAGVDAGRDGLRHLPDGDQDAAGRLRI